MQIVWKKEEKYMYFKVSSAEIFTQHAKHQRSWHTVEQCISYQIPNFFKDSVKLIWILADLEFNSPVNTMKVMLSQTVYLTTLIWDRVWYIPAGTWRKYNFASTSMQRHDVASTLRRRCIYVMCLPGSLVINWLWTSAVCILSNV